MSAGTDRRTVLTRELWLPLFPVGEYRANNGQWSKLEAAKLREMERNTRFLIRSGNLAKPPVGYQHPASSGEARGHIGDVKFENGVLHARIDQPKFIDDVKKGLRLEYSGEFAEEVDFVEQGVAKKCGPAVVGVAILGDQRPAIKNAQRRTLSDLVFGEGVTPVEAFEIKEELRKSGVVSHTYDAEGHYCFSEIAFDASVFAEEKKPMTPEELAQIKAMIDGSVTSNVTALKTDIDTQIKSLKQTTDDAAKQFSEAAKNESKINAVLEGMRADKKVIGKVPMANFEKALREPTFETVKAFGESLSGVIVNNDGGDRGEGKAEPTALAKLRVSDFADLSKNDRLIASALVAFGEAEPQKWSVVKDKPYTAQLDALKTHVAQRDAELTN